MAPMAPLKWIWRPPNNIQLFVSAPPGALVERCKRCDGHGRYSSYRGAFIGDLPTMNCGCRQRICPACAGHGVIPTHSMRDGEALDHYKCAGCNGYGYQVGIMEKRIDRW